MPKIDFLFSFLPLFNFSNERKNSAPGGEEGLKS